MTDASNATRWPRCPRPSRKTILMCCWAKASAAPTPRKNSAVCSLRPRPVSVTTFCAWPAPGCAAGELLGLRAARVDLAAKRLEVVGVRYDAGKFGHGYKDRPKSRASIRAVPLAAQVTEVIARQLAATSGPRALVFTGPAGGNGVAAGTRTALSRYNLRRAYRDARTAPAGAHRTCGQGRRGRRAVDALVSQRAAARDRA